MHTQTVLCCAPLALCLVACSEPGGSSTPISPTPSTDPDTPLDSGTPTDTGTPDVAVLPELIAAGTLFGEATSERFGEYVAGAGDVNGDGFGDVVFGLPYQDGELRLFVGSPDGLSAEPALRIEAPTPGLSVAGAGDVNGDGYDDVIVGAYAVEDYRGAAFVYAGAPEGPDPGGADRMDGPEPGEIFSYPVVGVGDINGDGLDDAAIGSILWEGYTGAAYVYHGSVADSGE